MNSRIAGTRSLPVPSRVAQRATRLERVLARASCAIETAADSKAIHKFFRHRLHDSKLSAAFMVRVCLLLAAALLVPSCARVSTYPHENEPIGSVREVYDGTLSPQMAVNTFRNIHRLFLSRVVPRSSNPHPLPVSAEPLVNMSFSDQGAAYSLDEFLDANHVAGLLVLQHGEVKTECYWLGNTERTRWMSMSLAKSLTSTLIGAALKEGLIASLLDPVTKYVPALAGTAYDGVSVHHVLLMSSGVEWSETYTDPASDRRRLLEAQISQRPGGALAVMSSLPRAHEPGTHNTYNTGETQIAAEVLRSALGEPLADHLHERIWQPVGMEADATWWTESPGGVEIGGSGFSATLRDYGYLWWPATSDAGRRDRSYEGEGIHGQFLYINPAVDLVIVLWSAHPHPTGGRAVRESAFFEAVTQRLRAH